MARISRRGRRRKIEEPPTPTPSLYPPCQSPLEQLPLEILQTVLLESSNEDFVRTSRTIWASLGYKPSEWLYTQFLKKKFTVERSHPDRRLTGKPICRALKWRGFTIEMYIEWITSSEPIDLSSYPSQFTIYPEIWPCLPKRWLAPRNESAIISLLRSHSILVIRTGTGGRLHAECANLKSIVHYYANPEATHAWPLALLDILGLPDDNRLHLFKIAVERFDVSFEVLSKMLSNQTFGRTENVLNAMSQTAFRSGRKEVIDWALEHGLAPSAKTLHHLFPKANLDYYDQI